MASIFHRNSKVGSENPERVSIRTVERIAAETGLDLSKERFTVDDLHVGANVEMEHSIVQGKPELSFGVALEHLRERPDYYSGLKLVEAAPPDFWRLSVLCLPTYVLVILVLVVLIYHLWLWYDPQSGTYPAESPKIPM